MLTDDVSTGGNFYPRSPCGERPSVKWQFKRYIIISIHALLAESDRLCPICQWRRSLISIHALLAESDVSGLGRAARPGLFLSTLSLRRATRHDRQGLGQIVHFYPRSPCGERLFKNHIFFHYSLFLSTLSLRRATYFSGVMRQNPGISIHALLAESDLKTPCVKLSIEVFLSTLSLRRATWGG